MEYMPSALPDGEPVPDDGALPAHALAGAADRPLGFYLHVPYCATRCGYCDFNTYTATELRGSGGVLASRDNYASTLIDEIRLARKVLGDDPRPVRTVFVGGGTPTLLAADDLVRMLGAIRDEFGLAADAEITTEANPESVDPAYLAALREGGFNRVSFGMQSARQHVLKVLDRTHTPGRPEACVAEARAAGFDHVNLDLIYGTPGESDDDWRASLDAAIGAGPDHVSAYALIVEEGTQLARRIRRGEVPMTDDDVHADRYLIAEDRLSAAGFSWYEVSNWATSDAGRCLHNELYWRGADWWGAGPGAHSHVGGVRWWNVKHPGAYAGAWRRAGPRGGAGAPVGGGPAGGADPAGAAAP
jgi:putative oxygen-independent coproporphyrinogen III oxidase